MFQSTMLLVSISANFSLHAYFLNSQRIECNPLSFPFQASLLQ